MDAHVWRLLGSGPEGGRRWKEETMGPTACGMLGNIPPSRAPGAHVYPVGSLGYT